MDVDEFWFFLERSARETESPQERTRWLEYRLSGVSRTHIADFQAHLNAARRPIDTYAMWGAACQIMDGLCSADGFWYFQPWLIGQGRKWYEHAARDPDNLADVPGVRVLSGRPSREWSGAQWPWWEELAYVALRVYDRLAGHEDSICQALARRGLRNPSGPAPADRSWDFDSLAEIQRRLPRIAELFPRQHYLRTDQAASGEAFLPPPHHRAAQEGRIT
jgi:hypothetical protein